MSLLFVENYNYRYIDYKIEFDSYSSKFKAEVGNYILESTSFTKIKRKIENEVQRVTEKPKPTHICLRQDICSLQVYTRKLILVDKIFYEIDYSGEKKTYNFFTNNNAYWKEENVIPLSEWGPLEEKIAAKRLKTNEDFKEFLSSSIKEINGFSHTDISLSESIIEL